MFVKKWGSGPGTDNNQLAYPYGVTVDQTSNVFVVDTSNQRISKFTATGTFIRKWGAPGTSSGQFKNPRLLVTDAAGNVYVADVENNRIQKF